jgi:hypothetical protein
MTHPLLSRAHLESLLVARAVVHRDEAALILAEVDRRRLSPAAWSLVAQLASSDEGLVLASDAQRSLAERVDAITVADLCFYPRLDTVLALVNQLPERTPRVATWERDLAIAQGAAA